MAFTFPTMHWEEVFWPGSCSCLWRFAQTYDISRVFQTDELQESSIPNWFCCIQLSYPTGNYFCSCFMQNHQHLFKLMLNLVDFVRHSRHFGVFQYERQENLAFSWTKVYIFVIDLKFLRVCIKKAVKGKY